MTSRRRREPVADGCVCFDVTFAQLRACAVEHGGGLDDLRRRFGCGRGCALCVPYIRRMLRTGETEFDPGSVAEEAPDD